MHYKLFGKSGLRVSELCLGAMTFGQEWGNGADQAESRKMFDAFTKAGGNFIDTANRYTEGTSEKYLKEFIASERDYYVLATKYSLYEKRDDVNASGNHRKNMRQSVEASLRRLGTDYIDVLWLHAWDFTTPVEEVMRGLDDLVRSGKVLYIGISDTPAWIVSMANVMAELRGWTAFVGLQIEYSLIQRTSERDLIPMANHLGMAITPWSPLGGGILTGKYNDGMIEGGRLSAQSRKFNERNVEIAQEVSKIAQQIGATPAQVSLKWLLLQGDLIIPIVGARSASQLESSLKCLDVSLNTEQIQQLDEISRVDMGFPHDFLALDTVRDVVSGGTFHKLINHRRKP
ncbi:MAG: aldo/keto reductase [Microscillaceae bacterium]|nr:aldo/keto reductase [Microscillaceae bacterium]